MLRQTTALFFLATVTMTTAASPKHTARVEPKKNVAILYFDNYTGSSDYNPLGKGISSMMISDLSSVKEIQLIERDRMEDLIKEIDNQHTKYYDSTTAVKVGKMVGAEYVVVGSFATVKPEMRIDTRVVRVQTGEIIKSAQVTGDQDKFFDLEKKLADRLIDGLGLALSPEEQAALEAQEKADRIDAVSTVASFSQALASYDRKDYSNAVQQMAPVMTKAPNSMVVQVAFSEMKSRAADAAKQSAADKLKKGLGGLIKRPPK